jgi:hypothetical protein
MGLHPGYRSRGSNLTRFFQDHPFSGIPSIRKADEWDPPSPMTVCATQVFSARGLNSAIKRWTTGPSSYDRILRHRQHHPSNASGPSQNRVGIPCISRIVGHASARSIVTGRSLAIRLITLSEPSHRLWDNRPPVEPERREARRPQSITDDPTHCNRPMARQRGTLVPPIRANEPSPGTPSPRIRQNEPRSRANEPRKPSKRSQEKRWEG